jgi:hypothetical protein
MKKRTFEIILASGFTSSIICYIISVVLITFELSAWYTTVSVGTALLVGSYIFMLVCANRIREYEE